MATPARCNKQKHPFSCPWPGCESSYDRRARLEHHYARLHIRTSNLRYGLPPLIRARSQSRLRAMSPVMLKSKHRALTAGGSRQRANRTHGAEGRRRHTSVVDLRSISLSPDTPSEPDINIIEQNQPIIIDTDTETDQVHVQVPNQAVPIPIGRFVPSLSPDTSVPDAEEEIRLPPRLHPSTMFDKGPRWAVDNDVLPTLPLTTERIADDTAIDVEADEMTSDVDRNLELKNVTTSEAGKTRQGIDEQEGNDQCVEDDAEDEITLAGAEGVTTGTDGWNREVRKNNVDYYNHADEIDELATDTDESEEKVTPTPRTPIASRQNSLSPDAFEDVSPFATLSKRAPNLSPTTPCPTSAVRSITVDASPTWSSEEDWNDLDPFIAEAQESLRAALPQSTHGHEIAADRSHTVNLRQKSTPLGDSPGQLFLTPARSFRKQSTISPSSSISAASPLLLTPALTDCSGLSSLSTIRAEPSSPTPLPSLDKSFMQSEKTFCPQVTDRKLKSEGASQIDYDAAYRLIKELKAAVRTLASGKRKGDGNREKDDQRANEAFYHLCEIWAL